MELTGGDADLLELVCGVGRHLAKEARILAIPLDEPEQAVASAGISGCVAKLGLGGEIGKECCLNALSPAKGGKVAAAKGRGFVPAQKLTGTEQSGKPGGHGERVKFEV